VDLNVRDRSDKIKYSAFVRFWKKWEGIGTVRQLFIDCKKSYDSLREVLYNILIEFGIPMKLVRLIKMCNRNL